jgi:hypothetical protein
MKPHHTLKSLFIARGIEPTHGLMKLPQNCGRRIVSAIRG